MTLKSYLWGIKIGAILVFAAWILVLLNVDPAESAIAGKLLFYGSFFLFLSAVFILFFTWIRKKAARSEEIAFAQLGASFRQGILLAFLVIILLFMQSLRVLVWWDGLLVVAGIFLIELYFLFKK